MINEAASVASLAKTQLECIDPLKSTHTLPKDTFVYLMKFLLRLCEERNTGGPAQQTQQERAVEKLKQAFNVGR